MKRAKVILIDRENGRGWFIASVFYVTADGNNNYIDGKTVGVEEGVGVTLEHDPKNQRFRYVQRIER